PPHRIRPGRSTEKESPEGRTPPRPGKTVRDFYRAPSGWPTESSADRKPGGNPGHPPRGCRAIGPRIFRESRPRPSGVESPADAATTRRTPAETPRDETRN